MIIRHMDSLWMDGADLSRRAPLAGAPLAGAPLAGAPLAGAPLAGAPLAGAPLAGDGEADVVIVGAGYTGLWTAYYLRRLAPGLRVLVLEAEYAGFGASGRNGGWCSAELPTSLTTLAGRHGRPAALAMHRAARDTLDEIEKVITEEAIDCGWSRDGSVRLARDDAQLTRLDLGLREEREFGIEDSWRTIPAAGLAIPRLRAAAFTPHCAAIQPGLLARELAAAVVRRGGEIAEGTQVTEIAARQVRTRYGTVRARTVVRATEAYTRSLRGQARRVAALASHVIATEPIPAAAWLETGWPGRATGLELRVLYPYLQRTADDRLVIGGRSIGYRYGSAADATDPRVWETLRATIGDLFPVFAGAEITHRWSGVLGAYRDFSPRVGYDRESGLAEAGGYVGDGVALANLAGRTLAALITGADLPEARLCWAGAPVARNWEPEPLRYLGIKTLGALARSADAREQAGRPAGLRGKIVAAAMS
jgi:glycine/D-amino acid oxidase-like deaminating enzyme